MAEFNRIVFLDRLRSTQLVAGGVMAAKGAHTGWQQGGPGDALMFAFSSFFLVLPLVALVVILMMRYDWGERGWLREPWRKALVTGLAICAVVFAVGAMGRG